MAPLIIKSTTNTKLKTTLWGIFFIIFGSMLEAGMIALCLTEGFSAVYVIALLLYSLIIWAGFHSLNMRKYPLVLLADDKGIHYFIYPNKLGYNKQEMILLWKEVYGIKQYIQQYMYEELNGDEAETVAEYNAIQIDDMNDQPLIISLDDTKISSETIDDVVLKLIEMWKFYKGDI